MLVKATSKASATTLRVFSYAALFLAVVLVHLSLTGVLRQQGLGGGLSLFISGAVVLGVVLGFVILRDWASQQLAVHRETQRVRQGLPPGPCCVVWQPVEAGATNEATMPWEVVGALRARYPALALQLGVEGIAIAAFEVSAEGRAKNIHCIDAWPSDVFYEAAREALLHARFVPKYDVHVRYGASYRFPFVFRVAGAANQKDAGYRARRLRPSVHAASQAVGKLLRGVRTLALTR